MIALAALYEGARGLSGVGFATAAVAACPSTPPCGCASPPGTRSGGTASARGWCAWRSSAAAPPLYREVASGPVAAPGVSWRDALGAAALGPFLALQVLVLSSPAFVASSGWQSLTAAHVTIVIGRGFALAFLASGLAVRAVPGGLCVLGGTVLGVGTGAVAGTYAISGIEVVPIVIVGQVMAAWLLAVAVRAPLRRAGDGGPVWRIDAGAALGGLLVAAILIPYQVSRCRRCRSRTTCCPASPGSCSARSPRSRRPAAARCPPAPAARAHRGAAALVLLAGTLVFTVAAPDGKAQAAAVPGQVRVLSYNIHDGVNQSGRLDPEGIARVIEGSAPRSSCCRRPAAGR